MPGSSRQRLSSDPFKRASYNSLHDGGSGAASSDEEPRLSPPASATAELSQRRHTAAAGGGGAMGRRDPQADQADRASGTALRSLARAGCTPRAILPSLLPVLDWLPSYSVRNQMLGDVIAGLTVGMMVIPQGLGYASVAMVPKVYGLYSAFFSPIVYAVVGGCKDVSVGPTAILSLLSAQAAQGNVNLTIQITMLCGLFQMALGGLGLGVLVDFISTPVLSGFTSAASIQIILTQIGSLCGYKLRPKVYLALYDLFNDIGKLRVADLALGVGSMVVLWFLGTLKTHRSVYVQQFATGRNAVLVCLGALLSLVVASASSGVEDVPWRLVGSVPSGLPTPSIPHLESSTLSDSKGDVVLIAFVGFLESIAIAKSFAKQNGYAHKLKNSQELFAVGLCNLLGSFFGSLPVTGSFSRTAVASQAGAKTQLQGVFTGIVVVLALLILTPAFYYIPTALLAAIVIVASINLVDYSICFDLWKLSWVGRLDLLSLVLTFGACIGLDIQYGIMVGVAFSLFMTIVQVARPRSHVSEGRELEKTVEPLLLPKGAVEGEAELYVSSSSSTAPASSPSTALSIPSLSSSPSRGFGGSFRPFLHRVPDWLMVWRVDSPLVFFNVGHVCNVVTATEVARFEMVPQKVEPAEPTAAKKEAAAGPHSADSASAGMLVNEAPSAASHTTINNASVPGVHVRLSSPATASTDLVAVGPSPLHSGSGSSSSDAATTRRRRRRRRLSNAAITKPDPGVQGLLPEPEADADALSPDDSLYEDDEDEDDAQAQAEAEAAGQDQAAGAVHRSSSWDLRSAVASVLDMPSDEYDEEDAYYDDLDDFDEEDEEDGEGGLLRSQSQAHLRGPKAPPRLRRCRLRALLLDLSCVSIIDTTAVRGLYQLCKDYASRARPVTVHFACVHPHVAVLLQRSLVGAPAFPHGASDRLHPTVAAGVAAITALARAHSQRRNSQNNNHNNNHNHHHAAPAPPSPSMSVNPGVMRGSGHH